MTEPYRVKVFAELGGVTVKALLHYERLGLLVPHRTTAGHRRYSARHLERLRCILALKRIGIPLRQMAALLDATPALLVTRLGEGRRGLAQERERLQQMERALALVEESLQRTPADKNGLSRLADVLAMARETTHMKRYFSDDVWEIAKRFYESWPSAEWIALCRDFAPAISDGPASVRARDLLRQWNDLARSVRSTLPSDPRLWRDLSEGFARAWRDRQHWSDTLKRRFDDYRMEEITDFIGTVSAAQLAIDR